MVRLFYCFILLSFTTHLLAKEVFELFSLKGQSTIYDRPGFYYKRYITDKKNNKKLPERLAFPISGSIVRVLDKRAAKVKDRHYRYVEFKKQGGKKVKGWLEASLLRPLFKKKGKNNQRIFKKNNDLKKCKTSDHSKKLQFGFFEDLNHLFKNYPLSYRSMEEVKRYTYKFRKNCNKKYSNAFEREYSYYIKAAAHIFDLPESFLACSFFVESQWDKTVKSHTGAKGLVQMVGDNTDFIDNILRTYGFSEKKINSLRASLEAYPEQLKKNKILKKKGKKAKRIPKWVVGNYHHAKVVLYNRSLAKKWHLAFDKIQNHSHFKKNHKIRRPSRFTQAGEKLAANSIIAGALYYRWILDLVEKKVKKSSLRKESELTDFFASISGAYNKGPYLLTRIIDKTKTSDPSVWRKHLAKNKEAKKHMENVVRCMDKKRYKKQVMYNRKGRMVDQFPCKK